MTAPEITYRVAVAADLPAITVVRTSVVENHLSVEQMAARGITEDVVAASFLANSKGWIAESDGRIVAFTIADRQEQSIFALFVLPGFDKQGIGSVLLATAVTWLWDSGASRIWLTTGSGTRAATFYALKGWAAVGAVAPSNIRFELARPQ